jgi:hypothetical protein
VYKIRGGKVKKIKRLKWYKPAQLGPLEGANVKRKKKGPVFEIGSF